MLHVRFVICLIKRWLIDWLRWISSGYKVGCWPSLTIDYDHYLVRSACLPNGLYIVLLFLLFIYLKIFSDPTSRQVISESRSDRPCYHAHMRWSISYMFGLKTPIGAPEIGVWGIWPLDRDNDKEFQSTASSDHHPYIRNISRSKVSRLKSYSGNRRMVARKSSQVKSSQVYW